MPKIDWRCSRQRSCGVREPLRSAALNPGSLLTNYKAFPVAGSAKVNSFLFIRRTDEFAGWARTARRADPRVNSNDSFGMPLTNGSISQSSPTGISRLKETTWFCK